MDFMVLNRMCKDWYFSHLFFNLNQSVKLFVIWLITLQVPLNLMEPPHDGYYVSQPSMQGLVTSSDPMILVYTNPEPP